MATGKQDTEQLLQACLEQILQHGASVDEALMKFPDQAAELRPELEMALWLHSRAPALDPRPGFVPASRRRLVSQIKQEQAAAVVKTQKQSKASGWGWLFARRGFALNVTAAVLAVACVFTSGSGIALASQDSLPGDSLYSVKLSVEQAELFFSSTQEGDAQLHIERAGRRLTELQGLILEGRYDEVGSTVAQFEVQVNEALVAVEQVAKTDPGQGRGLALSLQNTLEGQASTLQALTNSAPPDMQMEFQRAINSSERAKTTAEMVIINTATPPAITHTPTATAASSATPQPGVTATPTEKAKPTDKPTATEKVKPTDKPTATEKVKPTQKPNPTQKPKPTQRPKPTQKPKPTKAPK